MFPKFRAPTMHFRNRTPQSSKNLPLVLGGIFIPFANQCALIENQVLQTHLPLSFHAILKYKSQSIDSGKLLIPFNTIYRICSPTRRQK